MKFYNCFLIVCASLAVAFTVLAGIYKHMIYSLLKNGLLENFVFYLNKKPHQKRRRRRRRLRTQATTMTLTIWAAQIGRSMRMMMTTMMRPRPRRGRMSTASPTKTNRWGCDQRIMVIVICLFPCFFFKSFLVADFIHLGKFLRHFIHLKYFILLQNPPLWNFNYLSFKPIWKS